MIEQIELRPLEELPDFISDIMLQFIDESTKSDNRDILTAQYFDMMFRAGWQMAKNHYKK